MDQGDIETLCRSTDLQTTECLFVRMDWALVSKVRIDMFIIDCKLHNCYSSFSSQNDWIY